MTDYVEHFLKDGDVIEMKTMGTAKVKKYLAGGGQGQVYLVDYSGRDMALKWYGPNGMGANPQKFYENIERNVEKGAPSGEFLWPKDISKWRNGTFGYVMELIPPEYKEVSEYMLKKATFSSFLPAVGACLRIANAFRILHDKGYSYQDINMGNFAIDPKRGRVLICDCDNVAPVDTVTGVIGTPRFMAPEVVTGKTMPNSLTDRFSMAVLFFMLLFRTHPLEGKRYLSARGMTAELEMLSYGTEPLFIMDPDDPSNGPDRNLTPNIYYFWDPIPDYVREIFLQAFSQKGLKIPNARPSENAWMQALARFRSDIVQCSCGNDIFLKDIKNCICDGCGKRIPVPYVLSLDSYPIPGIPGRVIYRCQFGTGNPETAIEPIATVLSNTADPTQVGIINREEKIWNVITPSNKVVKIQKEGVVPMKAGLQIDTSAGTIRMEDNTAS